MTSPALALHDSFLNLFGSVGPRMMGEFERLVKEHGLSVGDIQAAAQTTRERGAGWPYMLAILKNPANRQARGLTRGAQGFGDDDVRVYVERQAARGQGLPGSAAYELRARAAARQLDDGSSRIIEPPALPPA